MRAAALAAAALAAVVLVAGRPGAAAPEPCDKVALGDGADLGGARAFPDDNPWNRIVRDAPKDPRSERILARIGAEAGLHPDFGGGRYAGARIGIPYVVVPEGQALVPVSVTQYWLESDPGSYPVPATAPIEGRGTTAAYSDAHVLVVQRDPASPRCLGLLYELFRAEPVGDYPRHVSQWRAAGTAAFDLRSNKLRPAGWTSADAAGLPIFPGLVRYDEVARAVQDHLAGGPGMIPHALRFTLAPGYTRRAYVPPARHWASTNDAPDLAPFGMRVRLRANYPILSDWPPEVQAILRTLKAYGMLMADNGGNWFVSGAPDDRWSNDRLAYLGYVKGYDFEIVRMEEVKMP